MQPELTDRLNAAARARAEAERLFPEERILLASAATVLETRARAPVGWSLSRILQRRCNLVITDRRVFIKASFLSPITVIWIGLMAYALYDFTQSHQLRDIAFVALLGIFLLQRRPYVRDVPFETIQRVEFGTARGLTATGDIITLIVGGRAIHLVTAQRLSDELRELLRGLRAPGATD